MNNAENSKKNVLIEWIYILFHVKITNSRKKIQEIYDSDTFEVLKGEWNGWKSCFSIFESRQVGFDIFAV